MEPTVFIDVANNPDAPIVVLHAHNFDERFDVRIGLLKYNVPEYSMITITDIDWNNDLTPWKADAIMKGQAPFGGMADAYVSKLTNSILPDSLKGLKATPKAIYIAGYSLAGLFSLYSFYKTTVFKGVACCSGSLWYPGFTEFIENNEFLRKPERLYLSLGDRESHTKNEVMAMVEDNTKKIYELYKEQGIEAEFEMNPGGHFDHPAGRLAKGIAYLLKGGKQIQ